MGGACSTYMGETRNVYKMSVGKPEGNRPLGRPRRRGEDNIKLDLKWGVRVSTGFNRLSIRSCGGLL